MTNGRDPCSAADAAQKSPAPGGAPCPPPLRMDVTSDAEVVATVRKAVEAFALAAGAGPASADVGLAVNEALANVIRHAYHGAGGRPISVSADCDGSELRITIRDWGDGVDPGKLSLTSRDPATPGGLGLICLRTLMDGVAYAPQPDGMMLTLTKWINAGRRDAERR